MKAYSLFCNCGCNEPLIAVTEDGVEEFRVFKKFEDALDEANNIEGNDGSHPEVREVTINGTENVTTK